GLRELDPAKRCGEVDAAARVGVDPCDAGALDVLDHSVTSTRPGGPARLAWNAASTRSSGKRSPTSDARSGRPARTWSSSTGKATRGSSEPYIVPVSHFSRRSNSAGSRSSRAPAAG